MGLLDFFGRANDHADFKPATTPPTKPRGGSGRWHTDGFLKVDEINATLKKYVDPKKFSVVKVGDFKQPAAPK